VVDADADGGTAAGAERAAGRGETAEPAVRRAGGYGAAGDGEVARPRSAGGVEIQCAVADFREGAGAGGGLDDVERIGGAVGIDGGRGAGDGERRIDIRGHAGAHIANGAGGA